MTRPLISLLPSLIAVPGGQDTMAMPHQLQDMDDTQIHVITEHQCGGG